MKRFASKERSRSRRSGLEGTVYVAPVETPNRDRERSRALSRAVVETLAKLPETERFLFRDSGAFEFVWGTPGAGGAVLYDDRMQGKPCTIIANVAHLARKGTVKDVVERAFR